MKNMSLIDYDNWYVLQTISRKEDQVKNKIDRLFNNYFNILIPLRELLHTKKGKIIFINKKKQKAKVRIKILNREVDTILGLNISKVH